MLKNAQVGEVSDAVIDNNGFLWIAGTDGLNRYDGDQHKYFRHDPLDSSSLFSNYINDLFLDEENNQLWISTKHPEKCGISILDLTTEQIKNVEFDPEGTAGLAGRQLRWVTKDRFGSYWVLVWEKGLMQFLPERDSIIEIRYRPDEKEANFNLRQANALGGYTFDVLNDSILWISITDGILKFNVRTHQFNKYTIGVSKGTGFDIRDILHHSDNQVYVATWHDGLYRFDPEQEEFTKINMEFFSYTPKDFRTSILGLARKSSTHLWVTTRAGLMEYDLQKNTVRLLKKNDYTKEKYYGVFQSDQKNRAIYWIFNSVYLFDPLRQQNKVYSRDTKTKYGGGGFIVRRVVEDENTGKLWIAAQYSEGLYRLDLQTAEWEVFTLPKSYYEQTERLSIWDVLITQSSEVLVLLSGTGLFKVSEKEKKLVPWALQPDIKGVTCRRMIEDSQGNIWVGGDYEGVLKIDPNNKTIRKFQKEFLKQDSVEIGWVKDLQEDRNGNIWICTKGYSVYNPSKDTIYTFPYFIPDNKTWYEIFGLGIDGEGNVLIGSQEKGIGITDADHPEKGVVAYFDKSNGSPTNYSYKLLLDQQKNVWSWGPGLTKINPGRSAVKFFNSRYFTHTEFWSLGLLANGNIVLGDRDAISIVNPDSLRVNEESAQPYVLSFRVFDEERKLLSSPFQATDIYLKPDENFFSLNISALNPVFFGLTEFLYQLEGVDPDWVNPKGRRYIAYTNIAGGNYKFKLKARNNEGVWNETPYVLRIHIAIPWYRSWWAYAAYISLFFGALYFWNRFRLKRRLEKEEALRLQELDTFKTRFYANITHEFRTPLTVIQGMANELEDHPEQEPAQKINLIKKNSRHLLALVNQMLDLSKLQAGKVSLDLKQDDIILFVKYLVESHESYAKMHNLGLQFYSEEKGLLMDFDAKKLEQILANLLSNAIKFTPEHGKVLVVAKKVYRAEKPFLEIKVKDSGIGISEENLPRIFDRFHQANPIHNNQGSGIGLAMVNELANAMNGSIKVESVLHEGSTFSITLPVQNQAPLAKEADQHTFNSLPLSKRSKEQEPVLSENGLPILLIIEDNIDVTHYLKTCLKGHYQIISENNGKAGVEKALEILPDVIISDVMMPEMDGFDVCKTLKEDERSNHIPIILLTAKATQEDKLEGLTQGADAYLIKPFEKAELMIRLDKLMEVRKTLQKKYSQTLISSRFSNIPIASKEDTFIEKVEKIILANLEDEDFSIDEFSRQLLLSRSQVHRKIKALTGMSPAIYIRNVKLQMAKELLKSKDLSVSEVAYKCGFKSPVYFSQVFKKTFGVSPNSTRK
ncbi:MAG: response regulator [Lewinellaceae bacterium]|nr:response regulator [Lewinellaceae bacterium]